VRAPGREDLAHEGATAFSRLPGAAFRLIRRGLESGPVLVQAPSAEHEVFGLERTADEMERAFGGQTLVRSGAGPGVIQAVGGGPQLVVATPGAEPGADGGYAAVLILDASTWSSRPQLDASVDALRLWLGAAALARPDGEVMLLGSGGGPAAQALVRWDPVWLASRELAERRELGLPPASKGVVLIGAQVDAADLLARADLPGAVRVVPGESRTVVLMPMRDAKAGVAAIRQAVRARSVARVGGPVRVRVDGPVD
jgi:primosomal protein N' (replication factor Y)